MSGDSSLAALIEARATPEQRQLLARAREVASDLGTPLFLVGGAVRDLLAVGKLRDLDLVVVGDGIDFARTLAARTGGSVRAHPRFMTAELELGDTKADVVTARDEVYEVPAALPIVRPGTLAEDAARRDFSVNAMAWELWPGEREALVDPYSGRLDLAEGRLRVLHARSFIDDPTRILRGVRLGARLQMDLEPKTRELAVAAVEAGAFDPLSATRLRQELILLLEAREAQGGLRVLEELGFLAYLGIEPALSDQQWGRVGRLAELGSVISDSQRLPTARRWLAMLTVLVGEAGEEDRNAVARQLELDDEFAMILLAAPERIDEAEAVLGREEVSPHEVRQMIDGLGPEEQVVLAVSEDSRVRERFAVWLERLRHLELTIRGDDLLALGFSAGPVLGRALAATLDARLDGIIEPDQELEFARDSLLDMGAEMASEP